LIWKKPVLSVAVLVKLKFQRNVLLPAPNRQDLFLEGDIWKEFRDGTWFFEHAGASF